MEHLSVAFCIASDSKEDYEKRRSSNDTVPIFGDDHYLYYYVEMEKTYEI